MVNFVRKVAALLQIYYPERLESLIVYPVPSYAIFVWGAIKRVFRLDILEKIVLVPGPAVLHSPLPKESLMKYVEEEFLDQMEGVRKDIFKPIGSYK